MKRLECEYFKKGASVKLTNPDPDYTLGPSNPAVGTEWECSGKVTTSGEYSIHVKWENGTQNSYKDGELSLSEEGSYINIWNYV